LDPGEEIEIEGHPVWSRRLAGCVVVARLTLQSVPRFMVVLLGLRCSGVGTTLRCLR